MSTETRRNAGDSAVLTRDGVVEPLAALDGRHDFHCHAAAAWALVSHSVTESGDCTDLTLEIPSTGEVYADILPRVEGVGTEAAMPVRSECGRGPWPCSFHSNRCRMVLSSFVSDWRRRPKQCGIEETPSAVTSLSRYNWTYVSGLLWAQSVETGTVGQLTVVAAAWSVE